MRLLLLVTTFCYWVQQTTAAQPTVQVGKTQVIGKQLPNSRVDFFGGIPFAKPPVGNLRLSLPVLSPTLNGSTFNASNFGPACIQIPFPPFANGVSEDCLSLTIFRPSGTSPSAKLPVIAWIYGGSFTVGDSSFYDASNLITRSVARGTPTIFVSMNYRVGPLGFPTGSEAGARNVLNLGLYDQLTALRWIQANIASFGGDKTQVTVMGESAGGVSIQLHLQQTNIVGLARGAIVESGGLIPLYGPEVTQSIWDSFVAAIPACASSISQSTTIDCLRGVDTASLLQAHIANTITAGGVMFSPVIDGPQGLIVGRWSQYPPQTHFPVLLGTNLDEGALFTPQNTNSTDDIRNLLLYSASPPLLSLNQVNTGIDALLNLYPDVPALGSPFGTGNNTFGLSSQYKRYAALVGDFTFTSSRRISAQKRSGMGDKVFAYLFTDHEATLVPEFTPPGIAPGSMGVPHTSEIPYVFGTLTGVSAKATGLSTIMQDYWLSFVSCLNPNDNRGVRRPQWPQYTPNNQVVAQLDGSGVATIPDTFRQQQIAFFSNNHDLLHTTLANIGARALGLSTVMQDYWLSFVNGLNSNGNHGEKRPQWEQYTPQNQVLIQLDGTGVRTIPDNFRPEQIAFFSNNRDLLHT